MPYLTWLLCKIIVGMFMNDKNSFPYFSKKSKAAIIDNYITGLIKELGNDNYFLLINIFIK